MTTWAMLSKALEGYAFVVVAVSVIALAMWIDRRRARQRQELDRLARRAAVIPVIKKRGRR